MKEFWFQKKEKQTIQVSKKSPNELAAPSIVSSAFWKSSSQTLSTLVVYRFESTNMVTQKPKIT